MLPGTSDWKIESAYDYYDDLSLDGLAWECLRRNPDYQSAFYDSGPAPELTELEALGRPWGLAIGLDPGRSAGEGGVFWSPEAHTGTVLLTPVATPVPSAPVRIQATTFQDIDRGQLAWIGHGQSQIPVSVLGSTIDDASLCVVIPLSADLPERIAALQRLWRCLQHQSASDHRLTRDKRQRLRQMLRASDGVTAGASHRDIAKCLFGDKRIRDELWADSSLRYTTQRLLRDARHMIAGGYRDLLSGSRPFA